MVSSLFKYGEVYWSLPMLFQYEAVYGAICHILSKYDIKLPQSYLYGSPACAWMGGRPPVIFEEFSEKKLNNIMKYVSHFNALPTFTFTRTDIKQKDLKDKYANLLLDTALKYKGRFIVYSERLRDYIKSKDPNATVVASVIKPALHFQGTEKKEEPTVEAETKFYNKLLKEYDIVVVRPEYSSGPLLENPSLIDDISRIEVLINQTCINNCPRMPEHYKYNESFRYKLDKKSEPFECIRAKTPISKSYKNHTSHTEAEIQKLVDSGVKHLKLQGRSDGFSVNWFMFLMITQMFRFDGENYFVATSFARGQDILKKEMDLFTFGVLEQKLPIKKNQ